MLQLDDNFVKIPRIIWEHLRSKKLSNKDIQLYLSICLLPPKNTYSYRFIAEKTGLCWQSVSNGVAKLVALNLLKTTQVTKIQNGYSNNLLSFSRPNEKQFDSLPREMVESINLEDLVVLAAIWNLQKPIPGKNDSGKFIVTSWSSVVPNVASLASNLRVQKVWLYSRINHFVSVGWIHVRKQNGWTVQIDLIRREIRQGKLKEKAVEKENYEQAVKYIHSSNLNDFADKKAAVVRYNKFNLTQEQKTNLEPVFNAMLAVLLSMEEVTA